MKRLTLEIIGLTAFGIQFGGIDTDSTNDNLESTILYGVTKVFGKGYPTFFNSSKIRQADKIDLRKMYFIYIIHKKFTKLEKGEVR